MGRELLDAMRQVDAAMQIGRRDGFLVNQWPGELAEACLHIRDVAPTAVLEIGVQAGGWIWAVREFCGTPLHYVGVDITEASEWRTCSAALAAAGVKLSHIRASSQSPTTMERVLSALSESGRKDVDLLHIDGDHSEAAALADFDRYAPRVRSGGLILMHDVGSAKGPRAALHTILTTDRGKQIDTARTVVEQHWEWRDRVMGIAILEKA